MAGGILQLVTSSGHENIYLTQEPQVTLFKKVYRRPTNFSFDYIDLRFSSKLDFGSKSSVKILPHGDLAHRMYFCMLLPDLEAFFSNLKVEDIINILRDSIFKDITLVSDKINTINVQEILELTSDTLECLNSELNLRNVILKDEFTNYLLSYDENNEHCTLINQLLNGLCQNDGFIYLKLDIINMWESQKINYKVISTHLEHQILQRNNFTPYNHLLRELDTPFLILYADVFYNILNNAELLYDFLMRHITLSTIGVNLQSRSLNDIVSNSILQTLDKVAKAETEIVNFNSQYLPGLARTISHNNVNILTSELAIFKNNIIQSQELKAAPNQLDFLVENFDNNGPAYYTLLNTYLIYSNLLNMLGSSVPLVIVKALGLINPVVPGSIYGNSSTYLETYQFNPNNKTYNLEIVPGYYNLFISKIIGPKSLNSFSSLYCVIPQPSDSIYLDSNLFSTYLAHPLADLINASFSEMNSRVRNKINLIYFGKFNSFMQNLPMMIPNRDVDVLFGSKQFGPEYTFPCSNVTSSDCIDFCSDSTPYGCSDAQLPPFYNNDVSNVFTFNTYLVRFVVVMKEIFIKKILDHLVTIFPNDTIILEDLRSKLNELFDNVYLNIKNCKQTIDLKMPDTFSGINMTMKTFTPPYFTSSLNTNDKIIITNMTFWRNLVPSMLEIMYFPINLIKDEVTEPSEFSTDLLGFFYEIIKYFMDNLDSMQIGAPARFNHQYILADDIHQVFQSCFTEPELSQIYVDRYNFYFCSETIYVREHSKFLNSIFSNKVFIQNEIGDTSSQINNLILGQFIKLNGNKTFEQPALTDPLRVQKYYDYLFTQNRSHKLYKSFYDSYKTVIPPVGGNYVDPNFIDNDFGQNGAFTRVYLDNNNIDLTISIDDTYELYDIDFYYIDHANFHNPNSHVDPNMIDDHYIAVNELYHIMKRLTRNYPLDKFSELDTAFIITKYLLSIQTPADRHCGFYVPIFRYDYYFRNNFELWKNLPQIENAQMCPPNAINPIPPFTGIEQNPSFPTYTAKSELELFLNYHQEVINLTKGYFNYDVINLIDIVIKSNQYVYQNINIESFTDQTNLGDVINILKNNFRKQYLMQTLLLKSNDNLFSLDLNKSSLEFRNLTNVMYQVLSAIENHDVGFLSNVSPFIFSFESAFPTQVQLVSQSINELSELSRRVSGYLISFMSVNNFQVMTERDIIDIFNNSFEMMIQMLLYCHDHNLIDYLKSILIVFDPLIRLKYLIYDKIYQYVIPIFNLDQDLTNDNILDLTELLLSYNLDMGQIQIVLTNYQILFNTPFGDKFIRANATQLYLRSKLDFLIIYSLMNQSVTIDVTFLEYIKVQILSPMIITNHPLIEFYLNLIDQETIEVVLPIINLNQINSSFVSHNVMIHFNLNLYLEDINFITRYYHEFGLKENIIEYILDQIYDDISSYCKKSLSPKIRYSLDIQNIHYRYVQSGLDPFAFFMEKSQEFYEIINYEKNKITEQIINIQQLIQNVLDVKFKINDIIYRNKRAHCAWIRNFGHFVIKDLKLVGNGQIIDQHQLDWFQIWNEITKYVGHREGYDKMIGNTSDLNVFTIKTKKGRLLYIPIHFTFNRNTGASMPLISLLHSDMELQFELRTVDELSYKDQFSEFNESLTILDAFVLTEYIYLEEEERKAFAQKKLEYLIEQTQLDNEINPIDADLTDIYEIACAKKDIRIIDNEGLNQTESVYDEKKAVEIPKEEFKEGMILFTRRDLKYERTTNQIGQELLKCHNVPLDVPDYIIKKKLEFNLHFNHPIEFFTTLLQVDKHIIPETRDLKDRLSYFYRERQFGNYALYSYYDLSLIEDAKDAYYIELMMKISNPIDSDFNLTKILTQIRFDYNNECPESDAFICNNFVLFINNINKLIHRMLTTDPMILTENQLTIIRLKESLQALNIKFPFYSSESLIKSINDILKALNIPLIITSQDIIKISDIDLNNFRLNYDSFEEIVVRLVFDSGFIGSLEEILAVTSSYYDYYNELQVNFVISIMINFMDLNILTYDFKNTIMYFKEFYTSLENFNLIVSELLTIISDRINGLTQTEIDKFNTSSIVLKTIKNIIYNLVPINDSETIPISMLNAISIVINRYYNDIFESLKVDIVDYQKSLKVNDVVNPMISCGLQFNGKTIMPENLDYKIWNYAQPLDRFLHTPSVGINSRSFALNPLSYQPTGSANFTKIDEKRMIMYVNPLISSKYSITISNYGLGYNVWRVLSGLNGTAFSNVKYY